MGPVSAPATSQDTSVRRPKGALVREDDDRLKEVTTYLSKAEVYLLVDAFDHARRVPYRGILRPLNWLLTIRPPENDNLLLQERQAAWTAARNHMSTHLRRRRIEPRYAWVRESDPVTHDGEHFHILLNLPDADEAEILRKKMARKFPGRNVVEIEWRDQEMWVSPRGIPHAAIDYLAKCRPPEHKRPGRSLWEPGGKIFGRRCGVTRNLSTKAIEAWRAMRVNMYGAAA